MVGGRRPFGAARAWRSSSAYRRTTRRSPGRRGGAGHPQRDEHLCLREHVLVQARRARCVTRLVAQAAYAPPGARGRSSRRGVARRQSYGAHAHPRVAAASYADAGTHNSRSRPELPPNTHARCLLASQDARPDRRRQRPPDSKRTPTTPPAGNPKRCRTHVVVARRVAHPPGAGRTAARRCTPSPGAATHAGTPRWRRR